MSFFPHYLQLDSMDCGPSCLRMIAKYYGRSYALQTLRDLSFITREGVSMLGISDAAESIGIHTQGVRITLEQLVNDILLPCILHYNQNHFVVFYKIKGKSSRVQKLLGKANSDSHFSTLNFQFFIADPAGQKYVMDLQLSTIRQVLKMF
ncbi:Lactococcin-G-processing and transport ATP-binding protein LagD [bioreactor metagenome]|uniref:Lactococcin-G-processing and transport ATP-binding protein LagD n=1 Tax=bioreactor metagenome TaxID=1076179 RepID=A0A644ZJR7_9ZZZZ